MRASSFFIACKYILQIATFSNFKLFVPMLCNDMLKLQEFFINGFLKKDFSRRVFYE